jgi:chemotaxis family two-component system response regulator Rcp1
MDALQNAYPIEILLVEDNPGDVRLTLEAFKYCKVLNHLHVVEDGAAALDFLYMRPPYIQVPRPDLILLDLNLPKKDGREILAAIKSDETLKAIPVVILTTSQAEEDILSAYSLDANCYVSKPLEVEQFAETVRTIESFWLTLASCGQIVERHGGRIWMQSSSERGAILKFSLPQKKGEMR